MKRRVEPARGITLMVTIGVSLGLPIAAFAAGAAKPVDFNRDILPILSDNCFACHGPDANKRKAKLRLDTKEGIFAERDDGDQIVVPGKSTVSELYARITDPDDSQRMPERKANRQLTPAQVELLKRWIDEGASYTPHWAYVVPKRPEVPAVKIPSWPRNPIDHFILARLEAEKLHPSPEADRATLLRRVSFDLTGLPPTPEEMKAFVKDRSANAYEKQVDRLLASPRYGENMARIWLDLARYADSNGAEVDGLRGMWPWRDWVINAYNRNLPYDQFTIEQLAGDLLPNATLEDKIATGFNRNHPFGVAEVEDTVPVGDEERAEHVADRVSTAGTTWLGLTVGCARCHDHKYDPIKQKDFYRLTAYFNNVPEFTNADHNGNTEPAIAIPSAEQLRQISALDSQIHATLAQLSEKEVIDRENQWRTAALTTIPLAPKEGLTAYYEFNGTLADSSGQGHDAQLKRDQVDYLYGAVGKGAVFNGTTQVDFGNIADFDCTTPFALALWTNPKRPENQNLLHKHDGSTQWAGWEIALEEPLKNKRLFRITVRLASRWPDNAIEITSKEHILKSSYFRVRNLGYIGQHLVVNYDGSGKGAGLKLFLDGNPVETEITRDQLTGSCKTSAALSVSDSPLGKAFTGTIDDLRIYNRLLSDADIDNLHTDVPARGLVDALHDNPVMEIPTLRERPQPEVMEFPNDEPVQSQGIVDAVWQKRQQVRLSRYFLSRGAALPMREAYARLTQLRAQKTQLENSIPTTMVMEEMDRPRDAFVLGRGQFDNKLEKVTPGVPTFVLPLPKDAPANRLALARWLVDPQNPLTARVEVNRYWQHFFGTGIVKTAENFGSQGERPTHPELLDWLATEFVRTGWDIKAMQRLIVLSATYRQSSILTPQLKEADPENRFLARGPRVRLAAEEIRDSALSLSGLLVEKIGGPSVYPYQPAGLWTEGKIPAETVPYKQAMGADLYRRSLYSVWRRSALSPAIAAFDAPDRETCIVRRNPTNTPLQALVLMDDPTYVEASRLFAQRAMFQAGNSSRKRIDFLFSWALERKPDSEEREVLLQEARRVSARFQTHRDAAQQLLSVGETEADPKIDPAELAAWTTVTRTILNMDETITKQ